ncbi:hypothetical protein DL98DRAFT_549327 [Cadophora sp. DSE1049]|nr:hypothetical protein DL98DRAFT_549327 [Cadophora sp. DSE1049]
MDCYSSRYSEDDLLIDTGASNKNTGGINQLRALQRVQDVDFDTSQVRRSRITFGAGSRPSLGTATVDTPAGRMEFQIVDADIPFLLLLDQHSQLLDTSIGTINTCYLTETEIRRLHKRFGHPSVRRLQHLLDQAGHMPDSEIMLRVKEMCEHCQRHAEAPHQFRFKLERYVLHMVDKAIGFGAAKVLRKGPGSGTARATFNAFKAAWIDTYLGPPDFVVYNYGTNFNSKEFRSALRSVGSTPKLVPIEAYHSIGKVERYHRPLRCAYEIVTEEHPELSDEDRLQIAVKAVNDTTGPNGLIPTLLVFGVYPRMTEMDPLNPLVEQRAVTIKKAIREVRKIHTTRKVNDALATRNGPGTTYIYDLRLNDPVLLPEVAYNPELLANVITGSAPKPPRIAIEILFTKYISGLLTIDNNYDTEVFLTKKKTRDRELSIKLRAESKIVTPGPPFQQSRRTEYKALIKKEVFIPVHKDDPRVKGHRIFKSRMVDEVKSKETLASYEKSRLVILTQSPTIQRLLRDIFAWPLEEIADKFEPGTVFMVVLPLYGIPESGNHWFNTYHKHHVNSLQIETSTYDPCLLISTKESNEFGIVGMQTDDTLILGDNDFLAKEQNGIAKAGFITKPIQVLDPSGSLTFNGYTITIDGDDLYMSQKEATFDLSQMDNLGRGLRYIPVNLRSAKIYIFVGFVLAIGTETEGSAEFTLSGNIIHTSFTKCKRVTRAVLASELYAIIAGIDILIALGSTINIVTDKLGLTRLPTVVCTDSLSLYECIRRELTEIRWIDGTHNPANAITKAIPNKALQKFIDTNTLTVKMEGW